MSENQPTRVEILGHVLDAFDAARDALDTAMSWLRTSPPDGGPWLPDAAITDLTRVAESIQQTEEDIIAGKSHVRHAISAIEIDAYLSHH